MGNWTDRFDPETVDEIKRYEVGEGDFLLAERLAMHKGVECPVFADSATIMI